MSAGSTVNLFRNEISKIVIPETSDHHDLDDGPSSTTVFAIKLFYLTFSFLVRWIYGLGPISVSPSFDSVQRFIGSRSVIIDRIQLFYSNSMSGGLLQIGFRKWHESVSVMKRVSYPILITSMHVLIFRHFFLATNTWKPSYIEITSNCVY